MKVNITLITRDRPLLVTQTLMSMLQTSIKADLTIVDDGSEFTNYELLEDLVKIIALRGWRINLIRNEEPSKNAGVTRNQAINGVVTRGDFLYCSDNDCYFHLGWLEKLISVWREAKYGQGYAILGGYNHPFHQPQSLTDGQIIENLALSSQSWLMEWSTWDRFGPLVEEKEHDQEFCNRVRKAGFKVGKLNPPVVVNTGLTDSLGKHIPGYEHIKKEIPIGVYYE